MKRFFSILPAILFMVQIAQAGESISSTSPDVENILKTADVKGGIIVHLDCGDGAATAGLRISDRFIVQGLDANQAMVERARATISEKGLYGNISVIWYDGQNLPYADNLVNLIIVQNPNNQVRQSEIMRVLAPLGVAYVNGKKYSKPWPEAMDDWPQYLHDASNNAVSRDKLVGPPRRFQWIDTPAWGRSHMTMSTLNCIVSSNGRLFTVEDQASVEQPYLPGRYALCARDAFNGIRLWTHPIAEWEPITRYIKGTSVQQQRRIAAVGDKVYFTPGIEAPVTLFDGATGNVLKVYENTEHTQELAYYDGILYCVIGDRVNAAAYEQFHSEFKSCAFDGYGKEQQDKKNPTCEIHALEADSGKLLWRTSAQDTSPYVACSLAVKNDAAVYHTQQKLVCMDRRTGKTVWSIDDKLPPTNALEPPTLVLTAEAVYFAFNKSLKAYSVKDGRPLWQQSSMNNCQKGPDLFVTDEAVWTGLLIGYQPMTGQVVRKLTQLMNGPMGHDRCYRNFITDTYYINSKTGGSDFVRLDGKREYPNPWVRGTCGMGVIPANGLLYSSPYSCTCVIGTLLKNFNALSTDVNAISKTGSNVEIERRPRLIEGPAHGKIKPAENFEAKSTDWPTYRRDTGRHGVSQTNVPSGLKQLWRAAFTTVPSAPTVAEGMVFAADVHAHTICAMKASDGSLCWKFTAGGRIDSPPTLYNGLCIFGSCDGWVYCVKAADGSLVWKFNNQPDRLIGAFGQLESAWPVFGSVLVAKDSTTQKDLVYFTAGRSSYVDGGIFVYGLEPATGKVVYETQAAGVYDDRGFPATRSGSGIRQKMKGFKGDILLSHENFIFCRHQAFKTDLTSIPTESVTTPHIIASPGFLDDTPQHRTYWTIATDVTYAYASPYQDKWATGTNPQGDILVQDGNDFYEIRGFPPARHSIFKPDQGYTLWAGTIGGHAQAPAKSQAEGEKKGGRGDKNAGFGSLPCEKKWSQIIPLTGKAIIKAGDTIFAAGEPVMFSDDNSTKAYEETVAGKRGGVLWAASAKDGRKLAEYKLDAAPVWDGLAAADGKLFVSLKDGSIVCFAGK